MPYQERLFDRHPAAVRAAREFAAITLAFWRVGERVDDAVLCVSELATNAVEHGAPAGGRFRFRLELTTDRLRFEVHDTGSWQPVPRSALGSAENCGRGLFLVGELSDDDWSVEQGPAPGKNAWSEFKVVGSVRAYTEGAA